MTDQESMHVVVCSGPRELIEMLAVVAESDGFVVATRASAGGGWSLLAPEYHAEEIRSLISQLHRDRDPDVLG